MLRAFVVMLVLWGWISTGFLERGLLLWAWRSQYFWSGATSLEHLHFFPSVLLHLHGSGSDPLENLMSMPPSTMTKLTKIKLLISTFWQIKKKSKEKERCLLFSKFQTNKQIVVWWKKGGSEYRIKIKKRKYCWIEWNKVLRAEGEQG